MILDSLRYWVQEMHVDGFRFDLASAFSRNEDGSLDWSDPPIFGEIRGDPNLGNVRLIAEPWDAAGAYQLGESFPGTRWLQWNGRFRDDVRRFVRGDGGLVPSLMYCLYGSDDLFPDDRTHAYHPYQSVNYVTAHDGFTLYDLLAYRKRRNWANGHDNKDGTFENYSSNCGHEGDVEVPKEVVSLRHRQAKNFCCLLFLANGTPMFLAGDEFLQTQGGNNNPYNQDNETTWLDWDRRQRNADVFRFFRLMIAFRRAHPSLCRSRFWRDDVKWYGTDLDVDMSETSRQLAYYLDGQTEEDDDLYVMINFGSDSQTFTIPEGSPHDWRRVIDTSCKTPYDIRESGQEISIRSRKKEVKSRSIVVLVRHRRRAQ
jgi:glycogen operon protein